MADNDIHDYLDMVLRTEGNARVRRHAVLRDRLNPLEAFDDVDFFARFRVNKNGFNSILGHLSDDLPQFSKNTNNPLNPVQQLSVALRFYATGDFQISCGDFQGIDQSTVSRIVHRVTEKIASLSNQVIVFPEDCSDINQYFLDYCGLPGITGLIDGSQIPIQSPGGIDSELFRCRKGFFSFNVQLVCDHRLKIMDLVTGWPGSTHDSRVWNNSRLCAEFSAGIRHGILLGDSGYPLEPFLLTPYPHPPNSRARGRFNRALCKARCGVERCIGLLKRRWPCLSRKLRCAHTKVPAIIVACCVLHNLCIEFKQPTEFLDEGESQSDSIEEETALVSDPDTEYYRPGSNFLYRGEEIRYMLTQRFDS